MYADRSSRRGDVRIFERSATRVVAGAQASSAGDVKCCKGPMAIRLPSEKDGGAYTAIQGSAAAFSIMEDVGLPGRCMRSLGHVENTVYQA